MKKRFALDGTPQPVPVQPTLKTLLGRNVLLGPLVDATFTTLAAISDNKAIVCSEKGDVCLLDDTDGQKLMRLTNTGFSITCIAVDITTRQVRIGGRSGKVKLMGLDDLLAPNTPPESPTPRKDSISTSEVGHLCAMGYAAGTLITIDSKHSIEIMSPGSAPETLNSPFAAHDDAILGVRLLSQPNDMDAAFFTWSANGTIVFWDLDGNSKKSINVEIEHMAPAEDDFVNQCLIVRSSKGAKFLIIGDRYGVLRIIHPVSQDCTFETRAHMSEVQDIAIFENEETTLIASCGRDRTVQLFRRVSDLWVLVQTLDEHSASVCSLFFAENGEKLISCSTDRTIHIRQLVKKDVGGQDMMGAVPIRVINLKASPVSMAPCLDEPISSFVVSLLDRTVATYEISSGRLISSFRATDADGTEAVVVDSLRMGVPGTPYGRPTILAGVSSTDKSVRIYDGLTGAFLDREWGHTAAVTDVALLETPDSEQKLLISTGSDGTIMIWNLFPRPELQDSTDPERESSPSKEATVTRPPLRRVLSKAELAEFQRASPVATPTNRGGSPPRVLRKKTSRYGLSAQSPTILPPIPSNSKHISSASDDSFIRKGFSRNRSRSPPPSPKGRESRRPSLASALESRGRTKSNGNLSEFGTLNMATEQACRTLRAYRKKLLSSDSVKDENLKELDQELRLTAIAVGEKLKSKAISETVLAGLLDQYSDRLVTLFDEKLRLTKLDSNGSAELVERPKSAGSGNS